MHRKDPGENKQHLGNLLLVYKARFQPPQATMVRLCCEAIKDVTGFSLKESDILYNVNTRTLSLRVPSLMRSELQLHQAAILDRLESKVGSTSTPSTLL